MKIIKKYYLSLKKILKKKKIILSIIIKITMKKEKEKWKI